MLRPWLLQGVEPVIVHVPRKTDIIWVWGVFFGLWGLDGSPKTARIQPSVSMSRVSPHSCVVKTARCASGTCVVEPTLWKGQSSTVQYSVVWQFRLRIVHFSYRSFLICLIATIWFALNLTHLYTYHFDGFQVGGVGRCRGSHENVNSGRPPRSFNPFEFGLTEALLLSLITTTTDAGGPPQPTLPCSLTPQGPTLAWRRRREWLWGGGRGRGRAACPGVAAWSESWAGAASLVSGEYHLGEPDEGVSLWRGPQHADLPDGLLTVVLRQVVGLLYAVTLRQPINQGPKVRDSVINTYLYSCV